MIINDDDQICDNSDFDDDIIMMITNMVLMKI